MVSRLLAIIFVASTAVLFTVHAVADDLNINVCAAVRPCDSNGNVFPEFNSGACATVYQDMCRSIKPQSKGSSSDRNLETCMSSNSELSQMNHRKDQEIKRLKAQIRSRRSIAQ